MSEKVMLITGASTGIGAATARMAAAAGLKLALTARSEDKLKQLVDELGSDRAIALPADASSFEELQRVVADTVAHYGKLDVAFANAGVGIDRPGTEDGDPEEWRKMIDVNVMGLLYTAKASLPHLRKTKGHFILTASVAGRIPLKGSIYGASKWFAYGFGMNLANEMATWNGRCTTISPGMVNTPFFSEPKPDKLDPEDVAEAVMYAVNANPRNSVREVFLMPTN